MKRLLILTAVVTLTVGTIGCRCCEKLWRGACARPAPVCATPCDPCLSPCDPCATPPGGGMMVSPGPESYSPAPPR